MPADLLPPNATPLERAAAETSARVGTIPVGVVRTLWDPWTCPADLLPWLAWACSVDTWDDAWPETTQRRVIADSYAVHSVKGTVGAVKRALASLGYDTTLIEWHQEGGAPYTFRLEVDVHGKPVTEATYGEIERTALSAKNVRSHLAGLRAVGRVSGALIIGAVCLGGEETIVYPWTAPDSLTAGPLFVGGAVGSVESVTIYPAVPVSAGITPLFQAGAIQAPAAFSRASAAWLDLTAHAIDVPRIDGGAILIEGAATNLAPYSEDVAQWDAITITVGAATPPGDTGLAKTLTLVPAAGYYVATVFGADPSPCAISFWARRPAGGSDFIRLTTKSSGAWNGISARFALTSTWTRFSLAVGSGTSAGIIALGGFDADNLPDAGCDGDVEVCAFQVEAGAAATSYIPTSGSAATRAADVLSDTPPAARDIKLIGTAADGTEYTAGAPLVFAGQTTEWTCPAGLWSDIWAEAV